MFSTSSWPNRFVLALLALQLASACKPDPTPPPTGNPDTTPPSTRANPQGGNFTASVTVTLTCDDGTGSGCEATYYTTDGSQPSASSQRYTSPVVLSQSTPLKFFSVDAAGNAEAPQTQSYVVDQESPLTVASPAGGIINSERSVALSCTDSDGTGSGCSATYYTTDGTAPTTSSPRYTAPLLVSASTTLRFFSVDVVGNTEAAKTEQYTLDATAPTVVATPTAGNYATAQTVTLSCDDGAAGTGCGPIHYTTDGSEPTESSPAYTAPLLVSANTTLRFRAVDGAGNSSPVVSAVYVIDETGPATTATPPGALYNTPVSVVLACDDGAGGSGCASTYYTTDGSPPTTGSARYTTALPITSSTPLKFFSVDKLGNPGPTGTAQYTLDFTAPVTTANPPGGTYPGAQTVVLECKDGTGAGCAATYYTLDGTTPTRGSSRYTTPLHITANTPLRFFSVDKANNTESVRTEEYELDSVAPGTRATPAGGLYKNHQSVVLSCDDGVGSGCAETHYTVDGSMPTMVSPKYTSAILLTGNTTLRFFSVDGVGNQEAVQTEAYTIDTVAPSTTANPAEGTYGSTVSVTLACDDGASGSGCAETRYTVDGSAPTTSSPLYSGAISISATTTLRYFSTDRAGNREPTRVALYTLDLVAPTVSASPRGGLYNKAQSITLACSDTGGSTCAAIHYTTDGSVPTTASATYSAPLPISANTTLEFLAVDKVGNASDVQTETYRIDDVAPTTTATPPGGPYADSQSVTLRCGDGAGSGCTATYYTLDGSTPTSSSSTYSAPFTLTATTTLKFFSVDAAGNAEPVKTVTYVIDREKPTVAADPPGGTYRVTQGVTLTCTDTGGSGCASIHYTTDGSPPTTGSATYSAPLAVSANTTLRFLAVDLVGNTSAAQTVAYVIDTVAPGSTATPAGGTYATAKNITLNCIDNAGGSGCAATYYTTNGSPPSTGSTLYTGPFSLSANTTLRFFSVDAAGNSEPAKMEAYTIDMVAPSTTANPAEGTYGSTVSVTLACDDGASGSGCAETRYTVDGSAPTTSSPLYSGAISISATTTLRYFSTDRAGNREPTRVASYLIDRVAPTVSASVRGGTYRTAQTVALTCSDTGGSTCDAIHYTLDGSTPSLASLTYGAPLTVSANTTLKFLAVDKVGNVSGVSTESYVIDTVAPVTTAIRAGGAYGSAQSITLLCADGSGSGCSATYFTLDGSTPTTGSSRYASPIPISANATLRFFSVDVAGNAESPKTEAYVIDTESPTVTAELASGAYNSAQSVTLSCTDNTGGSGCAAIHYTTDGSWPTTSSPLYTGPITVSTSTTLAFFAVDTVGNGSATQYASYIIDTVAPFTAASPSGGTYTAGVSFYLDCWDDAGSGCAATHYTTDGSTPTTSSPVAGGYFYISSTTTLKFFSVDVAGNAEPVRTETYVIVPDTTPPTTSASPAGGTYTTAQYVYLSCSDDTWCYGTYYTLDGSEPTTASSLYSGALYISSTTTLKFFSVDWYGNAEPVHTETYTFVPDTTPPTTYASPAGGTYSGVQNVYLSCSDNTWCDSTYYTLDGSEPTTASPRFFGSLYIFSTTTLKFFSVDWYGNAEPVRTETYTFVPDTTPPTTYVSPAGGTYSSAQYVYLSCSDNTWCDSTYYTLDGSEPTTASPRYPGYLYLFSTTTLKFFSVDGAGNAEPVRTEHYVIEVPPADPSAQIAYIRTLVDGTLYEPITGALVTYTKSTTGPSDPAGFFLQGSAGGPALFVAIEPLTLSPTPQPGDRVSLHATQKETVNGLVQLTQIDPVLYTVHSRGEPVEPFRIDASSSDLVLDVGNYESRLISFSGTVASDFATAGTGHVSANVVSLGNPTVSSSLKLRLTTPVQSALDLTQGCSVTTNAPLWRFNTQAQPSAWTSTDLTVLSCPAPRVLGASSTSDTAVVVAFDRRIDPATVSASGSQFTFDNGLVATSATATDRQVLLTTSSQVEGMSYRVTVAPSILDTRGSAIDGSANSASFTGYTSTPTPGSAQLRLSEVSPGILNGRDLVELIAIRGGSVDGFTLTMGATLIATFPNVQVAAGDVIVVHLKPDATTNGDASGSETTSKSEFPAGTYSANYDTAWDFLGSTSTEIGYSRRVLRVRDAMGAMQDGAAFGRPGGTPPGDFLTQLKQLQDEGAWLPVDCGGVACSDTTSPTALDVSVDWAGCGTSKSGSSVRRVSATDNNVRTDWAVGTSSLGLANP